MCVHARVYVCMCGSLRSALNAFTRLLSIFVLETGFLIEPVVLIVSAGLATGWWPGNFRDPQSLPILTHPGLQACDTLPTAFHVGSRDLNTGPRALVSGTLPTEPSLGVTLGELVFTESSL